MKIVQHLDSPPIFSSSLTFPPYPLEKEEMWKRERSLNLLQVFD